MWLGFQPYKAKRETEAARLIAEFHQRFNAGDLDAICRDAYKCNEIAGLRQDWQSTIEETRSRGGAFQRVVRSDFRVTMESIFVRADVVSSFENARLHEMFVIRNYDSPMQIVSYKVVLDDKPSF